MTAVMNDDRLGDENDDGRDAILALAIASGNSQKEAAKSAGCSERTVRRRMQDERFVGLVRAARSEMFATAYGRFVEMTTKAATKLNKLLDSKDERIQLGAIRAAIDVATKMRDQHEIIDRLEKLEAEAGLV